MDLANCALRTSPRLKISSTAHGLNISSIRVFDQIRDPEIPINLRPRLLDVSEKFTVREVSPITNMCGFKAARPTENFYGVRNRFEVIA